jgi:hypothetical protein
MVFAAELVKLGMQLAQPHFVFGANPCKDG